MIIEALKLSNFSCSSSKVIGVSPAWTTHVSSLFSLPRPSSILFVRSFASNGAPRRASSSAFAFMACRNAMTPLGPLVIRLIWLLACLMCLQEGLT